MLEYSHVTSSLIDVGHVLDQRPQGVPLPLILELLVGIFHLGDDEHDDTYIHIYICTLLKIWMNFFQIQQFSKRYRSRPPVEPSYPHCCGSGSFWIRFILDCQNQPIKKMKKT